LKDKEVFTHLVTGTGKGKVTFAPMAERHYHIALVGNPNSGKSSLFNELTGLRQKVGNFPGVTVEKKAGKCRIGEEVTATIIDLPGTYSLYPRREDEWVAYRVLMGQDPEIKADLIVLVADASNLKRNLLFVSQIIDLKVPVVVALTMVDMARQKGLTVDIPNLSRELGVPVIPVNPRRGKGTPALKKAIEHWAEEKYKAPARDFIQTEVLAPLAIEGIKKLIPGLSNYQSIHYLINYESFQLPKEVQESIEDLEKASQFNPTRVQADEILQRYQRIGTIMKQSVAERSPMEKKIFTEKLDNILLHRTWGYVILFSVLFLLFQSVFWLAEFPMNGIEWLFAQAGSRLSAILPENWISDLLINGILAGLSGILVFVPQIMILFGLITLLEDTGYMARISFLSDKLMRKVGLNGKSVMPMISGFACAVPAIMSTRSIENKKERLLTLLITPLMSCSARLPVFSILITLVIPSDSLLGFFSLRGLVMMGLYVLGFLMALAVSYVAKFWIKINEKSFFILELPSYRGPRWKNIVLTMLNKARIFVVDAGKIIMIISVALWALSSFGPGDRMDSIKADYAKRILLEPELADELEHQKNAALLEGSYAGIIGRSIEPVIRPLGYDWKIGIALITSFAAREVFVGTMATLYSVQGGNDADANTLSEKMGRATYKDGSKVYTLATGISLMLFYLFAMQCMSTLAVVKRETRSWKWPAIQFIYMTALAYAGSLLAYQLLS
jgi:ferrous iron transport protein B